MTIITDDVHRHLADVVSGIVADRGGWPHGDEQRAASAPRARRHAVPVAPPRSLHQAIVNSDEIIIITNLEWANRFAHVAAVKESCRNMVKIASVEEGMGSTGLTLDHINEATTRARTAIAALAGKKHVRVTSAKGTDVIVSIEGRPARGHADTAARLDDGSFAALGGGRLRGGRRSDQRHDRGRWEHARHRR